jgi:hypothetical protein
MHPDLASQFGELRRIGLQSMSAGRASPIDRVQSCAYALRDALEHARDVSQESFTIALILSQDDGEHTFGR